MDATDAAADVLTDAGHPSPIGCEDAGATLIYVTTQQGDLWSLYPPTLRFVRIGRMVCPTNTPGATPFSMAVDHGGTAYVVYSDGELFRVSTATASCRPTNFALNQQGFLTFGMGFSQNQSGIGETLYVASDLQPGTNLPPRLGTIDTATLSLRSVALFQPPIGSAELTGTGGGDLFAFFALGASSDGGPFPAPSAIGRIDKTNGLMTGEVVLDGVGQGCAWAFAFWGGDFYTFTAPPPTGTCSATSPPPTVVTRMRPADGTVVPIATFGAEIVGAGVSTCAPQQ